MGIKVNASYQDPQFSPGQAPECKLSVLIGVDSFCFEVSGSDGKSLVWKDYDIAPASYDAAIRELFDAHETLQYTHYAGVNIGLMHGPSALAPARFFDPGRAADYWQTLSPLPGNETALCDAVPAFNAYMTWPLAQSTRDLLYARQPHARIFHGASAWLEGIYRQALAAGAGGAVFVHTFGNALLVAALEGSSLRFFNRFSRQTARDFLYFVLLGLQQAQLSAEHPPLYISGKMTADSEIYLLLQRYFPVIHFLAPQPAGHSPGGQPHDRHHWHFDLVCVRLFQ